MTARLPTPEERAAALWPGSLPVAPPTRQVLRSAVADAIRERDAAILAYVTEVLEGPADQRGAWLRLADMLRGEP